MGTNSLIIANMNALGFGGAKHKYDPDAWIDKMLISYFDTINAHFDVTSKNAYLPVLQARLQPSYVDTVTTGYLYNTFGPAGQNKTVCDWIISFNITNNLKNSGG